MRFPTPQSLPMPPDWQPRLLLNVTVPGLPHRHVVLLPALPVPARLLSLPHAHGVFTHDAGKSLLDDATMQFAATLFGMGGTVTFAFMEVDDATACLAWLQRARRGSPAPSVANQS